MNAYIIDTRHNVTHDDQYKYVYVKNFSDQCRVLINLGFKTLACIYCNV